MICARRCMLIGSLLLSGCTSPTRRQVEAGRRAYVRLRFDSFTTVIAVNYRTAEDSVPSLLWGVLELGGPVESLRGDTLIIEPHYILKFTTTAAGDVRIVRVNNKLMLPDLVYVPAGAGLRLVWTSDAPPRNGLSVGSVVVFGALAIWLSRPRW